MSQNKKNTNKHQKSKGKNKKQQQQQQQNDMQAQVYEIRVWSSSRRAAITLAVPLFLLAQLRATTMRMIETKRDTERQQPRAITANRHKYIYTSKISQETNK